MVVILLAALFLWLAVPAWAAPKVDNAGFHGERDKIAPFANNGPGLLIGDPIVQAKVQQEKLAAFGSGCEAWLNFVVSGEPECGKALSWHSVNARSCELVKRELRLSESDLPKLDKGWGISHAALGTIDGTTEKCKLTYRLYKLPSRKLVGQTTIVGSLAALTKKLPKMAAAMSKIIGVAPHYLPKRLTASADDLILVGKLRWHMSDVKPGENNLLLNLSRRLPLAGLMYLDNEQNQGRKETKEVVDRLVLTCPRNGLVYAGIAAMETTRTPLYLLSRCGKQLEENVRRYPGNSLYAWTEAEYRFKETDPEAQVEAAIRLVRCSTQNARAWVRLGWSVAGLAANKRLHASTEPLSSEEQAELSALDRRALGDTERSVELDPMAVRAWYELSRQAYPYGYKVEADEAYQKVLRMDCDEDIGLDLKYSWGLYLYGKSQLNLSDKLIDVCKRIGNDVRVSRAEREKLADDTKGDDDPTLAAIILGQTK